VAIKYNLAGITGTPKNTELLLNVQSSGCEGTNICTLSVITSDWNSKECSWIYASSAQAWNSTGGDYSNSNRVTSPATKKGGMEIYAVGDMVKNILDGVTENRGFILEPASNIALGGIFHKKGHYYYSSEHPDIRLRPALILEY